MLRLPLTKIETSNELIEECKSKEEKTRNERIGVDKRTKKK